MRRVIKGDSVVVISGGDKGKVGKVVSVDAAAQKVVVAGVNVRKRHQKASPVQGGGIIQKEMPVHLSNVQPIDPETNKATRVRFEVRDGKKVRVAKSGAVLSNES